LRRRRKRKRRGRRRRRVRMQRTGAERVGSRQGVTRRARTGDQISTSSFCGAARRYTFLFYFYKKQIAHTQKHAHSARADADSI